MIPATRTFSVGAATVEVYPPSDTDTFKIVTSDTTLWYTCIPKNVEEIHPQTLLDMLISVGTLPLTDAQVDALEEGYDPNGKDQYMPYITDAELRMLYTRTFLF